MSALLRSFARPGCMFIFLCTTYLTFSQVGTNDIIPPSPTAASLGVMDMHPADLYTGSVSPSILLGTIQSRSLSLDLVLRYSSSGFRPAEAAPWTGLGWNLNIGGVISRSARGLPDDRQGRGYFDNSGLIPSNPYLFTATYEERLSYAAGLKDLEPDIFSYSFPGSSGKMIFSDSEGVLSPFLQPASNTRIRMFRNSSWIEGFELTANDGTRYFYGRSSDAGREAIEYTEYESISGIRPSIDLYPSAWFLTEIISADKTDTISIYYSNDLVETCGFRTGKTIGALKTMDAQGGESCEQLTENESSSIITHYTCKADSIVGAGGSVLFSRSADRLDLIEANKLNKLEFCNMNREELKSVEFFYGYFGGEYVGTEGRLRLDSLQVSGGEIKQPPYLFDYYPGQALSYNTNSYDHWGYYNGVRNQELLPAVYPDKNAPFTGARRYPSFSYSVSTILRSITYPIGGKSTFTWEGHDYGFVGDKNVYNSLYKRENAIIRADADNKPDGAYDETLFYIPFSQQAGINIFLADRTGFMEGFVGDVFVRNSNGNIIAQYSSDVVPDTLFDDVGFPSELNYQISGQLYLNGPATYTIEANVGMIDNYASASISWNVPNDDPETSGAKTSACGGVRIKKTTLSDGKGLSPDIITRYEYNCFSDTLRSSGVLASGTPKYYYPQFVPQYLGTPMIKSGKGDFDLYSGQCEYRIYTQNNLIYNHFTSGSHVGYRYVKVIHGNSGEFGWEEYSFTSPYEYKPQVNNTYPYPPAESYSWKQGLLLIKKVYDAKKNKVESLEQKWDVPSGNEQNSRVAGGVKVCFLRNVGIIGLDSIAIEPYHFETGWVKLLWRDHTIDGVRQRYNYSYNSNYMLEKSVSYVGSDGAIIEVRKTYPFDIGTGVYTNMVLSNIISIPIETLQLRDGKIIQGGLSTWSYFGSLIKPAANYKLKINKPLSSISTFRGAVGSHYRQIIKVDSYDKYGNVAQMSRPADIPLSYLWGYNGNYPVAEIRGMSYDDVSGIIGSQIENIKSGDYDAKSVFDMLDNDEVMLKVLKWDVGKGVSRSITESGLSNYYEYDGFGRLKASYDYNGNLETMNLYNYGRDGVGGATGFESPSGINLSLDCNFTVEFMTRQEGLSLSSLMGGFSSAKALARVSYMDGKGRNIQSNIIKGSAWGEDLVTQTEYDKMGNILRTSLPFISVESGSYVNDYKGALLSMQMYSNDIPWSAVDYEKKINPRRIEIGSPGKLMQPGGSHTQRNSFGCNTFELSALRYSSESDAVVTQIYAPGKLFKSEAKDEDGRRSVEYKDTEGKVILFKKLSDSGDLESYYVYDEIGRLRVVVPPKAEGCADSLDLIYSYGYDSFGRRVSSYLPGQSELSEIIYDELDRPVLFTDARGIATYTLYDRFSRTVESGLRESSGDKALQKLYYDNYNFSGSGSGIDDMPLNASDNNKGRLLQKQSFLSVGEPGYIESFVYDDKGRVLLNSSGSPAGMYKKYLEYDFAGNIIKDRDSFKGIGSLKESNFEHLLERSYLDNNQPDETLCDINAFSSGGDSYILEKNIYDPVGRLATRSFHNNSQLANYTYNIRNQLKSLDAGQAFGLELFYEEAEDMIGLSEQFGGNISALKWQSEQLGEGGYLFNYDVINRLTEADWIGDGADSLFSTSYKYDKGGNIIELIRNMPGDGEGVQRLNDFTYLYKGNQLTSLIRANEKEYMVWPGDINNNGIVEIDDLLDFGLIYSKSSEGVPLNDRSVRPRDSISVEWKGMQVYEMAGDTMVYADSDGSGLIDLADTLAIGLNLGMGHGLEDGVDFVCTYKYDESGNMVYDSYKKMKVTYNCFNLPDTISFKGRGKIIMRYWPGGSLYDRRVYSKTDSLLSSTIYSGSYIFENDSLKQIMNSAGYIRSEENDLKQYYVYSDHLGNTRLVKDEDGTTVSEYNYYPFGLVNNKLSLNKDYKFRYNGKEEIEDFGLNWMAYGARMYDSELARWHVMDPAGESMNSWSPYNYTFNNPIRFIDPDGRVPDDFFFTKKGELAAYVENDDPDRVFIAKDDQEVYYNLKNATDESMYDQVEVSDEDVEEKMNENGMKKVVEEAKVTDKRKMQYHPSEWGGKGPVIMNIHLGTRINAVDHKYVDHCMVQTGYKSSNLRQERRELLKENAMEYTDRSTRTYEYGTKRVLFSNRVKKGTNKIIQSGLKITPWKSVSKLYQTKK